MPVVVAAGIDTWSPCWRLDVGSRAARQVDELASQLASRSRWLPESVAGHRVGWFPSAGLLTAEGHPLPGALASGDDLPGVLARLTDAIREVGIEVPDAPLRFDHSTHGLAGVRRLDVAVDVVCDCESDGLALLTGIASLRPPGRLASVVRRQPGGRAIETVYWQGARGVVARAYDKGVEANSAPRGHRPRFEDQRRWPGGHRRDVEELTAAYVADTFRRRFAPLWKSSKGVRVVTPANAAQKLRRAVEDGTLTPGQAVDAAGHLLLESAGVRVGHRATRYRHRELVDRVGLVLADGLMEEVEVPMEEVLEQVLETDAWERRG